MRAIAANFVLVVVTFAICVGIVWLRVETDPWVLDRKELRETPNWSEREIPQGMAKSNGDALLMTTYSKIDHKSRVYSYDIDSEAIEEICLLPKDATHTSGLANSGDHWIALDYESNKLYFAKPQQATPGQTVEIDFTIDTGLKGASACAYFIHGDKEYLAVTEFKNSKSNYILDYQHLVETKSFSKATIATYKNAGRSQGIVYRDGLLFDAHNTGLIGSSIDVISVDELLQKNGTPSMLHILTPIIGIEDLEFVGNRIYTTDEWEGRFHCLTLDMDRIKAFFKP